jgi:hypothetical protein
MSSVAGAGPRNNADKSGYRCGDAVCRGVLVETIVPRHHIVLGMIQNGRTTMHALRVDVTRQLWVRQCQYLANGRVDSTLRSRNLLTARVNREARR